MKCEVCTELLEEYLDGELAPQDHEQVSAHLIACVDCSETFAALTTDRRSSHVTIAKSKHHHSFGREWRPIQCRSLVLRNVVGLPHR
jgi:anti-sigma factor RsiW